MPDMSRAATRPLLRNLMARQAWPLLLVGLVVWLLRDRAAELDLGRVLDATRDIPAWSWCVAALATLVSFAAVGRYDAVIHRLLGTGVSAPAAQRSGIAAIATAQTTGFGLLIGTLARWRMLPQLSLWQSARVTMAVCRRLRRALRKAQAAGLRAAEAGAVQPLADMTRMAERWARRRGGARGFSLGRFAPDHLHRQKTFLCYDNRRRLVAFATFHVARAEWSLDQMCQSGAAPPGAMHLLIARAIEAAARHGCPRLSLAAVPRAAPRWLPPRLAARLDAASGAAGLRQFKSSFGPNRAPLYAAAPTRLGFCLGAIDVIDRITRSAARGAARRKMSPDS